MHRKKQELKQLLQYWDEILKATGFQDIERTIGGERVLIQYSSNVYRQAEEVVRESKISYFEQVSEKVNEHQFEDSIEQTIMSLIGEGSRIKEIVDLLNKKGISIHRQTVRFIIRRYETQWGIKIWRNKQMNLKTTIK